MFSYPNPHSVTVKPRAIEFDTMTKQNQTVNTHNSPFRHSEWVSPRAQSSFMPLLTYFYKVLQGD